MEITKESQSVNKNDSMLFVAFEPPRCIQRARKLTDHSENSKNSSETRMSTKTRTRSVPTSRAQFRPIQVPKKDRVAPKVTMDEAYDQITSEGRGAWRKPIPTKPRVRVRINYR